MAAGTRQRTEEEEEKKWRRGRSGGLEAVRIGCQGEGLRSGLRLAVVSVCVGLKGEELLSPVGCGVPLGVAQGVEAWQQLRAECRSAYKGSRSEME